MLEQILKLGFDHVELGHGVRLSLMEGIQKVFDRGDVRFSSLHNFCPLPVEITRASPNCYEFTSHIAAQRERALKLTYQTIDWAVRLQAPNVVLHMGSVPMGPVTDELGEMIVQGKQFTREFTQKKLAAVKERENKAPLYLKRSVEALKKIAAYAAERNIHLGVESREAYEELPTEREMVPLLDEINSPYVGYWHDFGHVQLKHNLSFLDHYEWLSSIRSRLIGCHLHDTKWPNQDHHLPGDGSIDYDRLIPLVPPETFVIWELNPKRKSEDIVVARAKWLERFGSLIR
jgi:sugar phosphate isomerase/epimerase